MLYVLYGGALNIGKASREYFKARGIEIIEKYNYLVEDSNIETWLDEKKFVAQSEIDDCDFYYELNGLHVGFNKEQIIDAAHGIKDCLLTMSMTSIDFIEHLKRAYGDYVTVIYAYIDEHTLTNLTRSQYKISEIEVEQRLMVAKQIKEVYLKNTIYFDATVIYADDDIFTYESLGQQYDAIIEQRKKIEKMLNDNRYIELPYIGSEPYIFVSYSHKDKARVYAVMAMLQRHGYRVWYDQGIEGGSNWRTMLRNKIKGATAMILFSSANSIKSEPVKDEISKADAFEIPIITVLLESSEFDEYREDILARKQKVQFEMIGFEKRLLAALPIETREDKILSC